jgi:hypothetical protein
MNMDVNMDVVEYECGADGSQIWMRIGCFFQFETDRNNETIDSYIIVASQLYINISNTQ